VELLEDLARDWSRDNNPLDVEGFRSFLLQRRRGEHRGRDWSKRILRAVLGSVTDEAADSATRADADQLLQVMQRVEASGRIPRRIRREVARLSKKTSKSGRSLHHAYGRLVDVFAEHYFSVYTELEAGH